MKYSQEVVDILIKHIRGGSTITSACDAVGISKVTFYEWMKTKPNFSNAIKKAQSIPNKKVEKALYKSAIGYLTTVAKYQTKGSNGKPQTKTIKKKILPNITAMIFWLKNKLPDEWKDKQDIEHSGSVITYEISEEFMPKKMKEVKK